MTGEPSVTVVVPVLNRRERMLRCLDAVLGQRYVSYDVLVLDTGSSDGTPEACVERASGSDVRVRVEVMPTTPGGARNASARLTESEIIAFTDSDCIPDPGWLAEAVAPFADPAVGVVTGTTRPEDPPPLGPWYASLEVTTLTWRFETANALFRRRALLDSDGFDESVWPWEDTAAGWAVLKAGWTAAFAPEAIVHHDVTYPGYWWHVQRVRRYGQGAGIVLKYPELRDKVFWARYFQAPRNARVAAAALGLALAPVSRKALLLALPYAWSRRPRGLSRDDAWGLAQLVLLDFAELEGMVRGSLRARRLML